MAYLGQDDKQTQNQQDPSQQGQINSDGGSAQPLTNSGNPMAGGSPQVSTAGIGAGGQGGWTNIQSYLNANQGNSSTANLLKQTVGNQFDQEQQNLQGQAQSVTDQGKKAADASNISTDQASKLIQQAGSNYSYSGSQNDQYNTLKNQLQGYTKGWSGPGEFSYAFDNQTQNYGSALGSQSPGAFQGILGSLYDQATGGQMNYGQHALQTQLDTGNQAISQTKQDLLNRYQGLNTLAYGNGQDPGLIDQTNQALQQDQSTVQNNSSQFLDWLTGQGTTDRSQIDSVRDAWNRAENAIASGQNKIYAPGSNVDPVTLTKSVGGGNSAIYTPTYTHSATIDPSSYYQYNPVTQANEANVSGVNDQRNQFNAIMDILGKTDRIDQGAQNLQHGIWTLNQDKYERAYNDLGQSLQDAANTDLLNYWHNQHH